MVYAEADLTKRNRKSFQRLHVFILKRENHCRLSAWPFVHNGTEFKFCSLREETKIYWWLLKLMSSVQYLSSSVRVFVSQFTFDNSICKSSSTYPIQGCKETIPSVNGEDLINLLQYTWTHWVPFGIQNVSQENIYIHTGRAGDQTTDLSISR